jgi:hypothetical protein
VQLLKSRGFSEQTGSQKYDDDFRCGIRPDRRRLLVYDERGRIERSWLATSTSSVQAEKVPAVLLQATTKIFVARLTK